MMKRLEADKQLYTIFNILLKRFCHSSKFNIIIKLSLIYKVYAWSAILLVRKRLSFLQTSSFTINKK